MYPLLADAIHRGAIGDEARITSFEDRSSPRPGVDELYFTVDPSSQATLPASITVDVRRRVRIPVDVVAFCLCAVGVIALVVRRGARAA